MTVKIGGRELTPEVRCVSCTMLIARVENNQLVIPGGHAIIDGDWYCRRCLEYVRANSPDRREAP